VFPSLLWLLSVMLIISIALFEERKLVELYGENYIRYINKTSFMLPIPKIVLRILLYPVKSVLGDFVEDDKSIMAAVPFFIYLSNDL